MAEFQDKFDLLFNLVQKNAKNYYLATYWHQWWLISYIGTLPSPKISSIFATLVPTKKNPGARLDHNNIAIKFYYGNSLKLNLNKPSSSRSIPRLRHRNGIRLKKSSIKNDVLLAPILWADACRRDERFHKNIMAQAKSEW